MAYRTENYERMLALFFVFLLVSFAALIGACAKGHRWGELSSRRFYGEVLSEDERKQLKHARRECLLWMGVSFLCVLLAFRILR